MTFWLLLFLNALFVLVYIFLSILRKERGRHFLLNALVMLLCPVVGVIWFLCAFVFSKVLFRKEVDLVDVLFSKEREAILLKAEEEKERNLLPLEDSLLISHRDDARAMFLEVIKREPKKSLYSISLALDSPDSEIAHYAASILQFELDKLRKHIGEESGRILSLEERLKEHDGKDQVLRTVRGMRFALRKSPGETEASKEEAFRYYADIAEELESGMDYHRHAELAGRQGRKAAYGEEEERLSLAEELEKTARAGHRLIDEIDGLLAQRVLSDYESGRFTLVLHEVTEFLEKRDYVTAEELSANVLHAVRSGSFEKAEAFSEKAFRYYPEALSTYSSRLKLLFEKGDREAFLHTLEEMKQTGLTLDHETLELVRFFS